MGLNVELLEKSFDLVAPKSTDITKRFYEILFDGSPEVRSLFKSDNSHRLLEGLVFIVNHLRNQEALGKYLRALGERHVGYGVSEEDYPKVGRALVKTLEEFSGEAWTTEIEQAWVEAYGIIQSIMLERNECCEGL